MAGGQPCWPGVEAAIGGEKVDSDLKMLQGVSVCISFE